MDTKLILNYRREKDCWLCPNCETENDMSFSGCTLCGYRKNPSVQILKAWSPEQERIEKMNFERRISGKTTPPLTPPVKGGTAGSEDASVDGAKIILILIAIFILIVILIASSQ